MPLLLALLVLLVMPFFGLWALNTLFGLGIPMTFQTWLAMIVLSFLLGSSQVSSQHS